MELNLSAYGKVACKRFIDNVPMMAQSMFDNLVNEVQSSLTFTDEELKCFMEESRDVIHEREQAIEQFKVMEDNENVFRKLQMKRR